MSVFSPGGHVRARCPYCGERPPCDCVLRDAETTGIVADPSDPIHRLSKDDEIIALLKEIRDLVKCIYMEFDC